MLTRLIWIASLAGLSLPVHAQNGNQPVEIRFDGMVGAKEFKCGESYSGVGTPAATIRPSDFRMYISRVSLIDSKGQRVPVKLDQDGLWQYRDVAMIDFEDGGGPCSGGNSGINKVIKGSVPKGSYVGLSFDAGLPPDLNHGDPATMPAPLNFTAMQWAWQAGFRFLRVDLTAAASQAASATQTGFAVHIGSTGCGNGSATSPPAQPCTNDDRVPVSFASFDPGSDVVAVDLAPLLAQSNLNSNTPNTGPGCMSDPGDDPDCGPIFAALGLPFGTVPASSQRVFRKR